MAVAVSLNFPYLFHDFIKQDCPFFQCSLIKAIKGFKADAMMFLFEFPIEILQFDIGMICVRDQSPAPFQTI